MTQRVRDKASTPATRGYCQLCKWAEYTHESVYGGGRGSLEIWCCRFPPTLPGNMCASHPRVYPSGWCGEFTQEPNAKKLEKRAALYR